VSTRDPKLSLGGVVLILLVITALWGLLTYGLEYLAPPPTGESAETTGTWSAPVVLAIGLLAGYVSGRYLMQGREPPGGIWTTLAAGVGGAWLGGILPCPGCWRWQDINVAGSIVLAFGLAMGVGRIGAYWSDKRR